MSHDGVPVPDVAEAQEAMRRATSGYEDARSDMVFAMGQAVLMGRTDQAEQVRDGVLTLDKVITDLRQVFEVTA